MCNVEQQQQLGYTYTLVERSQSRSCSWVMSYVSPSVGRTMRFAECRMYAREREREKHTTWRELTFGGPFVSTSLYISFSESSEYLCLIWGLISITNAQELSIRFSSYTRLCSHCTDAGEPKPVYLRYRRIQRCCCAIIQALEE